MRPPPATVAVPVAQVEPGGLQADTEPLEALIEPDAPEGIFHVVQPGQTLWRIARAYGVPLEELAAANGIQNLGRLEEGRALFVPHAEALLSVSPYPAPLPPAGVSPESIPSRADRKGGFVWPVAGEVLSWFGARRQGHIHSGLDIRGSRGQEVMAAESGRVVYGGNSQSGYGKMVVLEHGSGLESFYAHNDAILVRVGDEVERGQPIARVGRTGNATADHCHFEIRKDHVPVDPLPYLTGLVGARR